MGISKKVEDHVIEKMDAFLLEQRVELKEEEYEFLDKKILLSKFPQSMAQRGNAEHLGIVRHRQSGSIIVFLNTVRLNKVKRPSRYLQFLLHCGFKPIRFLKEFRTCITPLLPFFHFRPTCVRTKAEKEVLAGKFLLFHREEPISLSELAIQFHAFPTLPSQKSRKAVEQSIAPSSPSSSPSPSPSSPSSSTSASAASPSLSSASLSRSSSPCPPSPHDYLPPTFSDHLPAPAMEQLQALDRDQREFQVHYHCQEPDQTHLQTLSDFFVLGEEPKLDPVGMFLNLDFITDAPSLWASS